MMTSWIGCIVFTVLIGHVIGGKEVRFTCPDDGIMTSLCSRRRKTFGLLNRKEYPKDNCPKPTCTTAATLSSTPGNFIGHSGWYKCPDNAVLLGRCKAMRAAGIIRDKTDFCEGGKPGSSFCRELDFDEVYLDPDNGVAVCVGNDKVASCPDGMVITESCTSGCNTEHCSGKNNIATGIFCVPMKARQEADLSITGSWTSVANGVYSEELTVEEGSERTSSVSETEFTSMKHTWAVQASAGGVFKGVGISMEGSVGGEYTSELTTSMYVSTSSTLRVSKTTTCSPAIPFGSYFRQYVEKVFVDGVGFAEIRHCFFAHSKENNVNPQCPPLSCMDKACSKCAKNDAGQFTINSANTTPLSEDDDSLAIALGLTVFALFALSGGAFIVVRKRNQAQQQKFVQQQKVVTGPHDTIMI